MSDALDSPEDNPDGIHPSLENDGMSDAVNHRAHAELLHRARTSVPDHGQVDAVRMRDTIVNLIEHHRPAPAYREPAEWECGGCFSDWPDDCETTKILAAHFGVPLEV